MISKYVHGCHTRMDYQVWHLRLVKEIILPFCCTDIITNTDIILITVVVGVLYTSLTVVCQYRYFGFGL